MLLLPRHAPPPPPCSSSPAMHAAMPPSPRLSSSRTCRIGSRDGQWWTIGSAGGPAGSTSLSSPSW
eukprot:717142-Hanusia_phi.AAC.1